MTFYYYPIVLHLEFPAEKTGLSEGKLFRDLGRNIRTPFGHLLSCPACGDAKPQNRKMYASDEKSAGTKEDKTK